MTDSSSLNLPISQALTSDMMLGLKPSCPKSRSYRLSIPPMNKSTFSPSDQMIFEIPTQRKGCWLDQTQTYLKFSVQCASSTAIPAAVPGSNCVYLENTAYSFIQRLDVYNSSNLLESINEYGQLANFLIDTSLSQSDKCGLSSMIGSNYMGVYTNAAAPAQYTNTTTISVPGDRCGLPLNTTALANINTAIPYTFTLPILSGIIGCNASKMLPLGQIKNPIRCEFYLAANDDAVYWGATAGPACVWQLVNVEMCCCFVELQDDSLDQVLAPGESTYISTSTYRQASTYLASGTSGEFTALIPLRCASLNAIYARFRNYAANAQGVNNTAAYRKSSSINPNLSSYYFRIGSSMYPNKPIYLTNGSLVGTGAEAYAELLKSFHALSSSIGNTSITHNQYNVAATATQGFIACYVPASRNNATTYDTSANAFAIGLELQSFSNRNDTILSGVNTLNAQLFFTGTIASGLTAGGTNNCNYTVDFFGQMDMILVLQDGVLSAKY